MIMCWLRQEVFKHMNDGGKNDQPWGIKERFVPRGRYLALHGSPLCPVSVEKGAKINLRKTTG